MKKDKKAYVVFVCFLMCGNIVCANKADEYAKAVKEYKEAVKEHKEKTKEVIAKMQEIENVVNELIEVSNEAKASIKNQQNTNK